MDILLSIIIPMYNVEKYLKQCLNSFTELSVNDNVEILIINDGSTDRSKEIAEQYVKMYSKVMTLFNKENGGYGSAINYGIKKAKGRYIRILDSDDWVNKNGLFDFLKKLKNENSDIVATSFTINYMNSSYKKMVQVPSEVELGKQYSFEETCKKEFIAMHMMTIKRSIFTDNQILIDENTFYTDLEFVIFPLKYVTNISYYNINFYQYRVGVPGQSVSHEGWYKNRFDHEKVSVRLIKELEEYTVNSKIYDYIKSKIFELLTVHFKFYCQFPLNKTDLRSELINFENKISGIKNEWLGQCDNIWVLLLVKSHFRLLKPIQIGYMLLKRVKKSDR